MKILYFTFLSSIASNGSNPDCPPTKTMKIWKDRMLTGEQIGSGTLELDLKKCIDRCLASEDCIVFQYSASVLRLCSIYSSYSSIYEVTTGKDTVGGKCEHEPTNLAPSYFYPENQATTTTTTTTATTTTKLTTPAGDEINCPGRCWELKNGVCYPQENKITLDCSEAGKVKVDVDTCVFTPSGAIYQTGADNSYNLTTKSFTNKDPSNDSVCTKPIVDDSTVVSFDWSFKEAKTCGFEWSTENNDFVFKGFLASSDNVNELTRATGNIIIATKPADILLQCKYTKNFDLSQNLNATESTNTQNGTQASLAQSLDSLFDLEFYDSDYNVATSFTVGEQITAAIKFDFASGGFSSPSESPFGFFAKTCKLENSNDRSQFVSMISNELVRSDDVINLHTTLSYKDSQKYSQEKMTLQFDAFSFQTSSDLGMNCGVEICLKNECPV